VILNVAENPTYSNKDDYIKKLIENSKRIQAIVNKYLERSRETQKKQYDKFVSDFKPYEKDDLVLLTHEAGKPGLSRKLLDKYVGPFKVLRRINELNYEICLIENENKSKIVHYNRLKTFHTRSKAKATNNLQTIQKELTNDVVEHVLFRDLESDSEDELSDCEYQISFDVADELVDKAIDLITEKVLDELIETELMEKYNEEEEFVDADENEEVERGNGENKERERGDGEEGEETERNVAKQFQCTNCLKTYTYEACFKKHINKCK
jgi:hypothetical protein